MSNVFMEEQNINIFRSDCLDGIIPPESVHLGIFDPPFGLGETGFNKHYQRDSTNVLNGYKEAPDDYEAWTNEWLTEAKRILHPNGSMYIFMGHTNLRHLLNAAHNVGLCEINHLIWKYNFGVYTRNKYVTSHYHILYYSKSAKSARKFNTFCRFGSQEKDNKGGSLLYRDLEDVFAINKDYSPGKKKNQNKLPEELIKKLIAYSSNENDIVCDFFMGNFTTASAALKLGRRVCGYEINKESYDYNIGKINEIEFGCDLINIKNVNNITPPNQGAKITIQEIFNICKDYREWSNQGMKKGDISKGLQDKFGRGRFAIKNILDKYLDKEEYHRFGGKSPLAEGGCPVGPVGSVGSILSTLKPGVA
jgi:site-specific DNA-methyltransferase (adenine-specific)